MAYIFQHKVGICSWAKIADAAHQSEDESTCAMSNMILNTEVEGVQEFLVSLLPRGELSSDSSCTLGTGKLASCKQKQFSVVWQYCWRSVPALRMQMYIRHAFTCNKRSQAT